MEDYHWSIRLQIPQMFMSLERTEHDWQFHTEVTDKYCRSFKNGCYWPRGKMLGGSHGINALIYLRGNPEDYDNWHRLGNPTWDWNSVLEYFKKTEHNFNDSFVSYQNQKWHNDQGAMPVGHYSDIDNARHIFMDAAKELGYKQVGDFNADETIGFGNLQGTIKNGQRFTTAKSLLAPAKDRKNLHVIKYAHATRIIIDESKQATGIEFVYKNTQKMMAMTKKEVILTAGAIGSPQLLMLSGIGPKKHLEELKIPVIRDLSVGKNLQDHVIAPILFQFHQSTAQPESMIDLLDDVYNYAIHKKGPLAGVGSVNFAGLINTENQTGIPDIELQCFNFKRQSMNLEKGLQILGYNENVIKAFVDANEIAEITNVYVELLRPKSTGEIFLKSSNPFDKPRIIPNYFGNDADADTLVRGIQVLTNFLKTKSFKKHEGLLVRIPLADCDQLEYQSIDYWKCYVSHMATTVYHPIGTAKMGPNTDKDAVVDSELRVKGVKGLRVIDASIMPKMVSANTNAATIMIAEKGADFIKSIWSTNKNKQEL